jgi:hypothetical protein
VCVYARVQASTPVVSRRPLDFCSTKSGLPDLPNMYFDFLCQKFSYGKKHLIAMA